MATWCTNCRSQQNIVRGVRDQFGDDVVFISLSVENNLPDQMLADYAVDNNYGWTFVVATPELLTALVDQYGRVVVTTAGHTASAHQPERQCIRPADRYACGRCTGTPDRGCTPGLTQPGSDITDDGLPQVVCRLPMQRGTVWRQQ